ncbi:PAS domain S-box protein [Ammoniphilus sp. 3BR4]|uniref:PAS domain S-box protein n=1 Tax=Ammoniphilus sp. 3BR4 TaxID=3158265 RepID=UPI003467115F
MLIEERLEGQSLFVQAFEYAPIGMALVAPDGRLIKANSSAHSLLGYSEEEVCGVFFQQLTHPDDLERDTPYMIQLLQGSRDSYQMEQRFFHKSGSIVWVLLSVSLVKDEEKKPLFFIFHLKDITKQKIAEKRLQELQERYQSIFDFHPDLIYSMDLNGNYTAFNESFKTRFGLSSEELLEQKLNFRDLTYEEDLLETEAFFQQAASGKVQRFESRFNHMAFIVEVIYIPICVQNQVVGVYGMARDITERRRVLEEIVATRVQLESFIDNHVDPILIFDLENRLVRVNEAFESTFGWKASEIVGQKLLQLPIVPEERKHEAEFNFQITRNGQSIKGYETIRIRKNGIPLHVMVSGFPILDQKGNLKGWSICLRDITDQKKAEELLINSEKLSIAGELAAGIAHEIRNPITAIKGFVQLMKYGESNNTHYLDIMKSEIERIELILSELLLLAKPQMMKFQKSDLRVLVEQVKTLLESEAILKDVEIVTAFPPGGLFIECDENQLKQVFINFIKNAIESMSKGGTVEVEIKALGSERFLIRIADQGCGIPENILSKLGQPFYTTKEKGTGLGFMVSKKIIENHQGDIEVKSEVGKGTTIEVILPIRHMYI